MEHHDTFDNSRTVFARYGKYSRAFNAEIMEHLPRFSMKIAYQLSLPSVMMYWEYFDLCWSYPT